MRHGDVAAVRKLLESRKDLNASLGLVRHVASANGNSRLRFTVLRFGLRVVRFGFRVTRFGFRVCRFRVCKV